MCSYIVPCADVNGCCGLAYELDPDMKFEQGGVYNLMDAVGQPVDVVVKVWAWHFQIQAKGDAVPHTYI